MANTVDAVIKAIIENALVELMVKTRVENVYIDDTTTLANKLAEIITALNLKANASDVTSEINTAISNLIDGAPETYNTLKEISDYISSHEDVVASINAAIGNKVDKVSGKQLSTNDFTNALKSKLEGIYSGAEVNQNAFSYVNAGGTAISASGKTDTLNIVGSGSARVTSDASTNTVTISVEVEEAGDATQDTHGYMSASDKKKLDGIEEGANKTVVDSSMSDTSTNPVQNKVVKAAISEKPDVYIQKSQPSNMKSNDIWISY